MIENLCVGGIEKHYSRIEKVIDFHIKKYKIKSTYIDLDDLKQDLWIKIVEAFDRKSTINIEYIKRICEHTLQNIKDRTILEAKYRAPQVDPRSRKTNTKYYSDDTFINKISLQDTLTKNIATLDNPLEKCYAKTIFGNDGIPGFEKDAVISPSKMGGEDLLTAQKLGFKSNKVNRYVGLKKKVKKKMRRKLKPYFNDVA